MTIVVIVGDQSTSLKNLGRLTRSAQPDVIVHTFRSASQALEMMARETPDLIVADVMMPSMTGEQFILRCRQLSNIRDVPILVITSYEDRAYCDRALDAGASDFLISPIDRSEFHTRTRNLLALGQLHKSLQNGGDNSEGTFEPRASHCVEAGGQREEQLRRVLNTLPALIRATDEDGRIVFSNAGHESFFDVDASHPARPGRARDLQQRYHQRHAVLEQQILADGQPGCEIEEHLTDRMGRQKVLLTNKVPLVNGNGRADQIVTVSFDITERKRIEQGVRESEERFRSLVEGSVLGFVIERDGVPLFANRTFARIFGYKCVEDILALPDLGVLFASGEGPHRREVLSPLTNSPDSEDDSGDNNGGEPREFKGVRRDGTFIWLEIQTQDVMWTGVPARQSTVADVSLRKAYELRLQQQASFDELTGLPNRTLALDRLRSAVVSAVRHRHRGGVLFVDLDQFKKINDTWGHATGDQLLTMAAKRLQDCVREEDTVARLGGDEFTVILPNLGSGASAEPVIQKILAVFSNPFALGRKEAFVTASIGVSVFPDDSEDPATLLQHADAAMYQAKEDGRNTYQFFTPELNERALERMQLEGQLLHAIERNEFVLHFQPIVDVRSRQLVGAEALLRWHNPELGEIRPDRFVPLAEDTGLIVPIGRWLLDAACRTLAGWRQAGLPQMSMSVNVAARQLRGKGLPETVAQALRRYALPPYCLELEITEGCLMTEFNDTAAALAALDRLGVRLALDDFGTGYSCLSYLKQLPVDTLKIDKSFILNVSNDPGDATVVEAIIAMAHRLGIRVIGEGVETEEQLLFIRQRGCDLAQGFYFSRPLAAEDFQTWCGTWPTLNRKAR